MLELGSSEHGICPGKCYQVHLFLNKSISCQQHQRLLHLYRHINILFHIHPAHSICNLQTPQGELPTMATLDQYSDHCLKLLKTCGIDVWICGKLHVPNPHFYIPTLCSWRLVGFRVIIIVIRVTYWLNQTLQVLLDLCCKQNIHLLFSCVQVVESLTLTPDSTAKALHQHENKLHTILPYNHSGLL